MGLATLVKNYARKATLATAIVLPAFLSLYCVEKKEAKHNPYKGKTLDECIQIVANDQDPLAKAQDILDRAITYDNQRLVQVQNGSLPETHNGARVYSGETTYTRGNGVCVDYSSLAITLTSQLKGTVIDELYFADLLFTANAPAHTVALYKQNGKYGKLGQKFDFEPARFNNIWDAGEDAADDFNADLISIYLYSTDINWRNGTNDGLVCYTPFLVEAKTTQTDTTATITPNANGHTLAKTIIGKGTHQGFNETRTEEYNPALYKMAHTSVSTAPGQPNYITTYTTLSQDSQGRPLTAVQTDNVAFEFTWQWTYDQDGKTELQERYLNNTFQEANFKSFVRYQSGVLKERHAYKSTAPNYPPWTTKFLATFKPNGDQDATYEDNDNNGSWVLIP